MQEIKRPNCGKVFSVDDSGHAAILKQVHDKEFEKELKRCEDALIEEKEIAYYKDFKTRRSTKIMGEMQARFAELKAE